MNDKNKKRDDDEEKWEKHESFGMVSFSRVNGNPGPLFGSSLPQHHGFVSLSISRGQRKHGLGRDWYYGGNRGDIVEVWLSAAQFAELITTMNMGPGVPCTISALDGKDVPRAADSLFEAEKISEDFRRKMGEWAGRFKNRKSEIQKILEKKTALTKEDKRSILELFERVETEVTSNIPFALSQFQEATERVVTHAKTEIDAFVTNSFIAEGIRSVLDRMKGSVAPPELPPFEED